VKNHRPENQALKKEGKRSGGEFIGLRWLGKEVILMWRSKSIKKRTSTR